jgi:hypothetical protein
MTSGGLSNGGVASIPRVARAIARGHPEKEDDVDAERRDLWRDRSPYGGCRIWRRRYSRNGHIETGDYAACGITGIKAKGGRQKAKVKRQKEGWGVDGTVPEFDGGWWRGLAARGFEELLELFVAGGGFEGAAEEVFGAGVVTFAQ